MKLIATGDWHYTDKVPSGRIDQYQFSMEQKIKEITYCALENDAPILQAGDMTDSPFLSYATFLRLMNLVDQPSEILTTYGQHDLRYRNKGNTPLDALHRSVANFEILENGHYGLGGNVYVYGCAYGEEIPVITTPTSYNILIIHRMIVSKYEQAWERDANYDLGAEFLKNNKFDLIVSGDNHKSFVVACDPKKPRFLINCGSLMRSKIDQVEHEPFFCVVDTEKRTYEKHMIHIEDWSKVFDIEKKLNEEKRNEKLDAFVDGLSVHKEMGLNFTDNIDAYEADNNIPEELIRIRKECMAE